ncbi:MAG TPA: amidohydrolase family protein [Bryobacteraceae bacterium]|nr:amidohydrolase family protein [Bryobacteraceae bacterium]
MTFPHRDPDRRAFLKKLGALGAASLLPVARSGAQDPTRVRPFRIDTHSHFTVPAMRPHVAEAGQTTLLDWTPQKSIDQMDQGGIATSVLSVGDPGVWYGDDNAARKLARECNDFAAKMIADYPGRFALFTTLPLPDVEGALHEVEYGMDKLHAVGIGILSSYQGRYLGNPLFTPLMEELNRRKAVVYCHPLCAACAAQPALLDGQQRGVEFVFDTTRTILSLLANGTVAKFPDIKFIWSHGGGTVPFITSRLNGSAQKLPKGLMYELQKFYYDTAQAFNPYTLPSFKKMVPVSHILFGTDYPLGGGSGALVAKGLIENGGFSEAELRAIDRDNAMALLPALKGI